MCIPVMSACELGTCQESETFIAGCKKNRSLALDIINNVCKLLHYQCLCMCTAIINYLQYVFTITNLRVITDPLFCNR